MAWQTAATVPTAQKTTAPGWKTEPTTKPVALSNDERDALILAWQQAKKEASAAVERERQLRKTLFETVFPQAKEGTNSLELGHGYALKAQNPYTYKLDNKDGRTETALDAIEDLGAEGEFIADRLVNWKPELSVREYRKLAETDFGRKVKAIIDRVLTISPGSASLELIEPASKE